MQNPTPGNRQPAMVSPGSAAVAASLGGDRSSGGGGTGGSSSSKRPAPSLASPVAPLTKRGKVEAAAAVVAAEASEPKIVPAAAVLAGKKKSRSSEAVSAWAYMLSQSPGTPHVPIHCNEISVGKGNCHICLDGECVGEDLCLLRHLEQGGPCELEVTSNIGHVAVNGIAFHQGGRVILRGGDEVIFGRSGKHSYIFQHPLRDNEVTGVVPVSAYSLVESGPTVSVPTQSAEENKQTVVESATSAPSKWSLKDVLKQGILSLADIRVTFDNFPYYVSATTKRMLLSSAFVHMEKEFRKCLHDISSLNQRILLSGPSGSEIYQEELIKALAKHFNARILIVDSHMLCSESAKDVKGDDAPTFREGRYVEYIGHDLFKLRTRAPAYGSRGKVMLAFENNKSSKVGVRFNKPIIGGNNLGGLCEENRGFFCRDFELRPYSHGGEKVDSFALGKLIEVISEESNSSNLIVLLKDVENSFTKYNESHSSLRSELPSGVLIIGSHTQAKSQKDQSHCGESDALRLPSDSQAINIFQKLLNNFQKPNDSKPDKSKNPAVSFKNKSKNPTKSTKYLNNLFPNKIPIEFPQDEVQLLVLKKQLKHDAEILKANANVLNIHKFLTTRGIKCNDLQELSMKDQLLTNESVDKIIGSAVSHHIQYNNPPKDKKMVLPVESLKHASSVVHSTHSRKNALKDVITENKFEEDLLSNVISPDDTGVTFEDIGALDNVKETLRRLVMLPLQRPELFCKGQLRKPLKGILLFGPPGTGKTLLAKAVATEAGANFINISMSSITSKWFGDAEKYVKAIFSLASKLPPAVIIVDEVDSLLGRRGRSRENEATRRMKNEFMINWDGLRTKEQERIIILGATNRPFDLDNAVIRRFPRRLMVSLPDASNREKILKVILSKETLGPDVDLESVAELADGYSGSDLKNLCVCAAHCPIHEIIEKEKKEKSLALAEGNPVPPLYGEEAVRPLQMDDFKFALGQVRVSFLPDSSPMNKLIKEWNNKFGDGGGGSEENQTLSYYM